MARRGISPVIATVIIVAVAIAVSIAVGAWLMGLWGNFAHYSAVKITHAALEPIQTGNTTQWRLTLIVSNDGADPARLLYIQVKGTTSDVPDKQEVVEPGETVSISIALPKGLPIAKGELVEIKVYTSDGDVLVYPVRAG